MREQCLECVLKHLAQAEVLMAEAELGYPLHRWLAVGHLAGAEAEVSTLAIAEDIRYHRKLYIEENMPFPTMRIIKEVDGLYEQNAQVPDSTV